MGKGTRDVRRCGAFPPADPASMVARWRDRNTVSERANSVEIDFRRPDMTQLSAFTWGIFPYICLTVMIVGTIYRYQTGQLNWGSRSSEILEKKLLTVGSQLFHIGILLVFGGHVAGLLVPVEFYNALGI